VSRHSAEQVAAYLGLVQGRPKLLADVSEVEGIIEVPLTALCTDGASWQEIWWPGEDDRTVKFFADETTLGEDLLWGLSAEILWRLFERVTTGD